MSFKLNLYAGIVSLFVGVVLYVISRAGASACQSELVGVTFRFPPNCTSSFMLFRDILSSDIGSILALIGAILLFFAIEQGIQKRQDQHLRN